MADRFDIQAFCRDPELVARLVRAGDVFSFLNRQLSLPTSCVALVWGESEQPTVVQSGQAIESHGVRELLFVRTVAFSVAYDIDGLASEDGYAFSASVRLSVLVIPDRAELDAFRKTVLGSNNAADAALLQQHCEEAVRTALSVFAKGHIAADLVSAPTWRGFDDVLAEHFKPVGFESGLALGPDPRVTFESAAYAESCRAKDSAKHRLKRQQDDEQLHEAAAKARERHLSDLGALLELVSEMADDNPGVAMTDLVKTFNPAQRGALYEGLVALGQPKQRTESILVVAGNELVWFDPRNIEQPSRRLDLTSDAGPLRSVRQAREEDKSISKNCGTGVPPVCDHGRDARATSPIHGRDARATHKSPGTGSKPILLVGARHGVHIVEAGDRLRQTCIINNHPDLRGGINAAVLLGEHLYATHSEIGLVRWKLTEPNEHVQCLSDAIGDAKAVRDIQTDDAGRLWFSADHRVIGWAPDEAAGPILLPVPVVVTALLVADGFVHAGLEDGRVVRWAIADPSEMETVRGPSGSAVRSLAWTAGGGIPRMLIADKRPLLELKVVHDVYLGEYRCDQRLRWGFAAEDVIVGVNDRRDQLFTWRPDSPQHPAASISIGRLCGRSIQDVILLPCA